MRSMRLRVWWGAAIVALVLVAVVGFSVVPWGGAGAVDRAASAVARDARTAEDGGPTLLGRSARPQARAIPGPSAGLDARAHEDAASEEDAGADDAGDDDHLRDGLPLTADHPLVAPVIEVQERYTRDLLRHPLVVGTAVGMDEHGEIALVVLAKEEITDLPSRIEGRPVLVHVSGELFASKGKPPGVGGGGGGSEEPAVDPTARFDRPVPIGISTGHPDITAGTIGCRVTDGNLVFALSNNHVYADENLAQIDDQVIQPGTYDGGSVLTDVIGTLDDFQEIDFTTVQSGGANVMDAAVALCDETTLGAGTPSDGYGLPKTTTVSPAINLRVMKYGRTTGETKARIYAINASVNVGYSTGTAGYVNQIVVVQGGFSGPGDSGSLIVGQKGADARKPVALLFAGSSSTTIGSPIDAILTRFGVGVDGE